MNINSWVILVIRHPNPNYLSIRQGNRQLLITGERFQAAQQEVFLPDVNVVHHAISRHIRDHAGNRCHFHKLLICKFNTLHIRNINKHIGARNGDVHDVDQLRQQDLGHARDAVVHAVIMEVDREGIDGQIVRHKCRNLFVHVDGFRRHRLDRNYIGRNLRCCRRCVIFIADSIIKRQMQDLHILRLLSADTAQLFSLEIDRDLNRAFGRLILDPAFCLRAVLIQLRNPESDVIQKCILFVILFAIYAVIQGFHVGIVVIGLFTVDNRRRRDRCHNELRLIRYGVRSCKNRFNRYVAVVILVKPSIKGVAVRKFRIDNFFFGSSLIRSFFAFCLDVLVIRCGVDIHTVDSFIDSRLCFTFFQRGLLLEIFLLRDLLGRLDRDAARGLVVAGRDDMLLSTSVGCGRAFGGSGIDGRLRLRGLAALSRRFLPRRFLRCRFFRSGFVYRGFLSGACCRCRFLAGMGIHVAAFADEDLLHRDFILPVIGGLSQDGKAVQAHHHNKSDEHCKDSLCDLFRLHQSVPPYRFDLN